MKVKKKLPMSPSKYTFWGQNKVKHTQSISSARVDSQWFYSKYLECINLGAVLIALINSIETCLACLRSALSSWHLSSEFLSLRFSTLIFSTHWANSVLSTAIGELDLASVEMVMLVKSWKIWLKDNENTNIHIYMQIVSMYKDQSSRNLVTI